MHRDYKHRAAMPNQGRNSSKSRKGAKRKPAARRSSMQSAAKNESKVSLWRWGLVFGIVAIFALFLYYLSTTHEQDASKVTQPVVSKQEVKILEIKKKDQKKSEKVPVTKKQVAKPQQEEIQYDFYTILPEAEFVIPDYEVKTRKREERVGKAKPGVQYSVQAGAFRKYKDADGLKAKLLMMGFSPKIEKAVIGTTTWYRVKMGPYQHLASVDAIQAKLKSNKMDALVIEIKQ